MSQYSDLAASTEPVDSVEDLLATESLIWPWESEHDTSLGRKKKVFDKVMQLERLIEEEAILVEEMRQLWNHLIKTCRALRDQAGVVSDDLATQSYPSGLSGQAFHGLQSAVLRKLEELKARQVAVKETYHQMVGLLLKRKMKTSMRISPQMPLRMMNPRFHPLLCTCQI
ncbi:hypothetical protein AOLI_G00277130 [Acnodon oligacanthus]